jgi:gliding motility-associated-like protein
MLGNKKGSNMKKAILKTLFAGVSILLIQSTLFGQLASFQKEYKTKAFTHCYDISATPDGGYIYSGIEDVPNSGEPATPYVTKLDCTGEPLWTKRFGAVSGLNNTNHVVDVFPNNEYLLCSSEGFTSTFDILLVRLDADGNTVWRQKYGGSNEDLQSGVKVLSDGNIAVVGMTNSYGSNAGSFYRDLYVLKINGDDGSVLWSKTFGINGASARAYGVVEDGVGGMAVTGTIFHAPTVGNWAPLIRLDANGDLVDLKFYGLGNRNTLGLGLNRAQDGGFLLTGSTNILGNDWFDSRMFPFVIKTDADGNLEWGSVIEGVPNASNLGGSTDYAVDNGETIGVAFQTYFYQNQTVDPTKRILVLLDEVDGGLINARQYNLEGGQFPRIKEDIDGGYIMSAFTDENNGSGSNDQWWNGPIINKLDADFNSGCNETDRTGNTIVTDAPWEVNTDITFGLIDEGVELIPVTPAADSFAVALPDVEVFCEEDFQIEATIQTSGLVCGDLSVPFTADINYPLYDLSWDFGDGNGANSGNQDTITHTYDQAGTYEVELTIAICASTYTITQTITLSDDVPDATIDPIEDPICITDPAFDLVAATEGGVWSGNGIVDSLQGTFDPTTAGLGIHTLSYFIDNGECSAVDSIAVEVSEEACKDCALYLANIFTPDSDGVNDTFGPLYEPVCSFSSFEFVIFNRWGGEVFRSSNPDERWDGRIGNEAANMDVYVYVLNYVTADGQEQQQTGEVTLIR